MDENNKEVIEIRPEDKDFFAEFIDCEGPIIQDSIDHKKITLALDKAHDIRKFEIDLYWKRATYFFAFFTVITAAFGYLFTHDNYTFLAPALAIIGSVFALCFCYVNIGSKYWQENWEFIIDKIEYYVTGNLYKLFFFENHRTKRPSVTKINIFLSKLIIATWYACFILSMHQIWNQSMVLNVSYIILIIYSTGTTLYYCDKTVADISNNDKESPRFFRFRNHNYIKS